MVLLPSPTIYYYLKGTTTDPVQLTDTFEFENNPLSGASGEEPSQSDDGAAEKAEPKTEPGSRAGPIHESPAPITTAERINFAKILRRSKEQEAENQDLRAEMQELRAALASTGGDLDIVSVGPADVRPSAKSADKASKQPKDEGGDGQPNQPERLPVVEGLRAFATDEMLQEETRAAAKIAMDATVTSQLELTQYKQDVELRIAKKRLLAQDIQQTKAVNYQLSYQHLETMRQRNATAFQVARGTRCPFPTPTPLLKKDFIASWTLCRCLLDAVANRCTRTTTVVAG